MLPALVYDSHWTAADEKRLERDWRAANNPLRLHVQKATAKVEPGLVRTWVLCVRLLGCTPATLLSDRFHLRYGKRIPGDELGLPDPILGDSFGARLQTLVLQRHWTRSPGALATAIQYAVICRKNDDRTWPLVNYTTDNFLRAMVRDQRAHPGVAPRSLRGRASQLLANVRGRPDTAPSFWDMLLGAIEDVVPRPNAAGPVAGPEPPGPVVYEVETEDLTTVEKALNRLGPGYLINASSAKMEGKVVSLALTGRSAPQAKDLKDALEKVLLGLVRDGRKARKAADDGGADGDPFVADDGVDDDWADDGRADDDRMEDDRVEDDRVDDNRMDDDRADNDRGAGGDEGVEVSEDGDRDAERASDSPGPLPLRASPNRSPSQASAGSPVSRRSLSPPRSQVEARQGPAPPRASPGPSRTQPRASPGPSRAPQRVSPGPSRTSRRVSPGPDRTPPRALDGRLRSAGPPSRTPSRAAGGRYRSRSQASPSPGRSLSRASLTASPTSAPASRDRGPDQFHVHLLPSRPENRRIKPLPGYIQPKEAHCPVARTEYEPPFAASHPRRAGRYPDSVLRRSNWI